MIVALRPNRVVCLLTLLLLAGCDSGADVSDERLAQMAGGTLKETVPVSGKVLVDGAPQAGVRLYLHNESDGKLVSECRTDAEGKYCWTTHVACDGAQPGSYLLGFEYIPKEKKNDTGVDLFKGKYRDPRKSDFKLTVEKGKPQTDVNYELSQSGK